MFQYHSMDGFLHVCQCIQSTGLRIFSENPDGENLTSILEFEPKFSPIKACLFDFFILKGNTVKSLQNL